VDNSREKTGKDLSNFDVLQVQMETDEQQFLADNQEVYDSNPANNNGRRSNKVHDELSEG